MTQEPTAAAIFEQLAAPFAASELRTRPTSRGRELTYITARTARRRLNEVLGLDGWECKVRPCEQGVVCSITIHLPDGRSLTREAMGGYRNTNEDQDRSKSADSDAFKRACVLFRVGEYLYGEEDDPQPTERDPERGARRPEGRDPQQQQRGQWGNRPRADRPQSAPAGPRRDGQSGGVPRTGKAMWAWICEQEECGARGLKGHLAEFAQVNGWPDRCFRWDGRQVAEAHAEARRYLSGQGERSSGRY